MDLEHLHDLKRLTALHVVSHRDGCMTSRVVNERLLLAGAGTCLRASANRVGLADASFVSSRTNNTTPLTLTQHDTSHIPRDAH